MPTITARPDDDGQGVVLTVDGVDHLMSFQDCAQLGLVIAGAARDAAVRAATRASEAVRDAERAQRALQ